MRLNIIFCDILTPWIKLWFRVIVLVVAQAFLFPIPNGHCISLLVKTERTGTAWVTGRRVLTPRTTEKDKTKIKEGHEIKMH